MNHIYRIIWNHSLACWQAVSEIGKGRHKVKASKENRTENKGILQKIIKISPIAALVGLVVSHIAVAAPTGGQVSAGQASIQQQGSVTNIHQSSQNAAINWQDFSVKPHESVNFHQPNKDAITLNRVIGNEASKIQGAVNANGNVFISNPNGVLIGKNASINVGGLVATTQKISDADLMNGKLKFDGKATGRVENLGNIKVPKGGVVALIAPIVKNQGKIEAPEGKVLLASAESFRISLPNDTFSYTLNRGTLQGLVDNGGAIIADGGRVVLTAKGVSAVKKSVVKHSGTIQANTVRKNKGVVELLGDLDNSELDFSGKIKAEAPNGGDGGFVETSAATLKISDSAQVSTLAKEGKTGKWVIDPKDFRVAPNGGDMTGQQVSNALNSSDVELKSTNGASEGNGDVIIDDVIEWSQHTLTLNALNDIHINQTLNGIDSAKLVLKYGSEYTNNYYLNNRATINLPEGYSFTTNERDFYVIDDMSNDEYLDKLFHNGNIENIAIGKDIDLSFTRNKLNFAGWKWDKYRYDNTVFSGLGHTLNNLTINSNEDDVGLFKGYVSNRTIRDLHLKNVNIKGASRVGALAGRAAMRIERVAVTGNISGVDDVGGFVGGIGFVSVFDSYFSGSVSGRNNVGGFVGGGESGYNLITSFTY